MSSQTVISAENLGKAYQINHEADRQRYVALRDVVANKFKGLLSAKHPHPGKSGSREDFQALKNVNFEVKQGDVTGILGRNGAGKSTLLKIISRITEPSEGRVRIKGRISSLLEVGTGFHPELTGRENIFLNGAILGMGRAEIKSKFDEIVAFAEVEKFLDTAVKFYSSGMYVRLAFAVAAHLEPEILIVDEVLAVGDAEFQKKCIGKMGAVARQGRTILFVSHNVAAILSMCHRALILNKGELIADGTAADVVSQYIRQSQKDASEMRPNVVVDDTMRKGSPKELRILSVSIRNSKNEMTSKLKLGEIFSITIGFESLRGVENVCFGAAVSTLDGMRLLTTHHTDAGMQPITLPTGTFSISTTITSRLRPGIYCVDVGAVRNAASGASFDYVPAALKIEVLGTSFNDGFWEIPHMWCMPQEISTL